MKRTDIPMKIGLLLCVLLLSSCQQLADLEEEGSEGTEQSLKVSARATGDSQIDYPAYIYAFDEDGKCMATQKMTGSDSSIDLKLAPAKYTLVAVAGVGEEYVLPKEPAMDDVITLKENNRSGRALMMGRSTVAVSGSKKASVAITLRYAVSLVNVTLCELPASVKKVRLQLSPLYSALSFNGEYSGGGKNAEVVCMRETDGVWSADPFYVFPGSGTQTVFSIITENDTQTQTYGYTFDGKPQANVPFNVSGSYTGEVALDGNLVSGNWETPVEVKFNFDTPGKDQGNTDTPVVPNPDGLPVTGSVWSGGIVAGFTNTDSEGADVLLMGLEEWTTLASKVQDVIQEAEADGWHLPDADEAKLLHDQFNGSTLDELNEVIEGLGEGSPLIDVEKRYLYDNDGSIYAFGFKPGSKFLQAGTTVKYKVRLVKTVRYRAK